MSSIRCTRGVPVRRLSASTSSSLKKDVYTHGHASSVVQSHAKRTAETCAGFLLSRNVLDAGSTRLLDVGCGPGSITQGLSARCARVDAVDMSGPVLEHARAAASKAGVAEKTFFQEASVYALPFADDTFDVVYAHQVLQHLADPVAALVEMRRVVKRGGGVLAVRDSDYSSMLAYPALPEIDAWRAAYRAVCYRNGAEPDAGRHLLHWAREAGFVAPSAEGKEPLELGVSTVSYSTASQCIEWGDSWKVRALESDFNKQAQEYGILTQQELESISDAWGRWGRMDSACFYYMSAELLATKF